MAIIDHVVDALVEWRLQTSNAFPNLLADRISAYCSAERQRLDAEDRERVLAGYAEQSDIRKRWREAMAARKLSELEAERHEQEF